MDLHYCTIIKWISVYSNLEWSFQVRHGDSFWGLWFKRSQLLILSYCVTQNKKLEVTSGTFRRLRQVYLPFDPHFLVIRFIPSDRISEDLVCCSTKTFSSSPIALLFPPFWAFIFKIIFEKSQFIRSCLMTSLVSTDQRPQAFDFASC